MWCGNMTLGVGWITGNSVTLSCALLLASGLGLSGCFDPQFAQCAVECGSGGLCPPGTTCSSDGTCHGSGTDTTMVCPQKMSDASLEADASTPDALVPDASTIDAGGDCGNNQVQPELGETCDDGNLVENDGCSSQCRTEIGFFCLGSPSDCAAAPTAGQLIITEIQKDPCADQGLGCLLNDISAEWFEIQNVSPVKLQLLNMIIGDNDLESTSVATPLTIGPGQIVLFGNSSNMALNGGVTLDYQYQPTAFVLANGADEIILINPLTKGEINRVFYNTVSFPSFRGSSLSLDPDFYDGASNNIGANWCDGDDIYGTGDFGTPGQVNPQCP